MSTPLSRSLFPDKQSESKPVAKPEVNKDLQTDTMAQPSSLEGLVRDLQRAVGEQDRRLQRIEGILQGIQDAQDGLARTFRQAEVLARQTQFEQDLQRSQMALAQALETQRFLTSKLPELGGMSAALGRPGEPYQPYGATGYSERSARGSEGGEQRGGYTPSYREPSVREGESKAYTMGERPADRVTDRPPERRLENDLRANEGRSTYGADNRSAYGADNRSAYGADNRSAYPADQRSFNEDRRTSQFESERPGERLEPPRQGYQGSIGRSGSTEVASTLVRQDVSRVPKPTVYGVPPKEFDAEKDASAIKKALAGWSINTKRIVEVVSNRNNSQRQEIASNYQKAFGKKLSDEFGRIGFAVGHALVRLLMPPAVFDAYEIYTAMHPKVGILNDDNALIEIICSRSPAQLDLIKESYKASFKIDLEADLQKETSGDYSKLLLELLKGQRDNDGLPSIEAAKADAAALYRAGEDRLGADNKVFIDIIAKRSFTQLQLIAEEYSKLSDYDLEKAIKKEMHLNLKNALITVMKVTRNPAEYFAQRLDYAFKGIGFNERSLTRIIISRSEIDLENIKQAFYSLYKRNLEAAVKSETSGDYRTLLYQLLGTDKGFNPEEDAKTLKRAFKGVGSDHEAIINVLGRRYNEQRQLIAKAYEAAYSKPLTKVLASELATHPDFEMICNLMLHTGPQLDAWTVRKCIEGLGTNDDSLIEVLCTRTNQELKLASEEYTKMYKKKMEQDVSDDTSGDYRKVLLELIKAERDETDRIDQEGAKRDAALLYKAGEDKIGTDEKVFIEVLTKRNYAQLRLIFEEYAKISDYDLEKAITKEMSFNLKRALVTIVKVTRDPAGYFAERLYKSMKGLGTNDKQLVRVILTRSEIDMAEIRAAFMEKYKVTLEKFIKGDTSGAYQRMLFKIIEFSSGASNI